MGLSILESYGSLTLSIELIKGMAYAMVDPREQCAHFGSFFAIRREQSALFYQEKSKRAYDHDKFLSPTSLSPGICLM